MRYISYYEEYPIYEPAEGGYYYAGRDLIWSIRQSKRKCKKDFQNTVKACIEDNIANGFLEDNKSEWEDISDRTGIYPWHIEEDINCIWKRGRYIGQGEMYVIERHKGSMRKGWVPYE